MPDFSMSNLAVAFSITLAAGLFTVLGSGLVMFSKTPNPRVLSFGLAFAGGAMVYVSLTEIFSKSSEAFAEIYDKTTRLRRRPWHFWPVWAALR